MTNSTTKNNPRTFLHYVFSHEHARKAIHFIQTYCCLYEGADAGKPIKLRKWQQRMVAELFGWIDPATGFRRYRTAFWFLPKKQGKSPLVAAIGAYMLTSDGENGAQVVLAANSKEQCNAVFAPVMHMVKQSPALDSECDVRKSNRHIFHPDSRSKLFVIPADAKTQQGLNISCLIYDEIAVAPNRDLYDTLTKSSATREQPLALFITTAGSDVDGIGYELYKYAKSILADPTADPTFYPVIYELGKDEDWTLEANWYKCNPALGDFNHIENMRAEFRKAEFSTSSALSFKMYYLNQWTQAADSWLDLEKWKKCVDPQFDESTLSKLPCYLAIDFAKVTDLTALIALWTLGERKYYLKTFFFIPDEGLRERCVRDHVPYDAWIEDKWVTPNPGEELDYAFPKKKIDELVKANNVQCIAYDLWGAKQFCSELEKEGMQTVMVRFGHQSLAIPSAEFEALIIGNRITHDNNPCMNWQIGNVVPRFDQNNNVVPDKAKSMNRIDGVAATIIGLFAAMKLNGLEEQKKPRQINFEILG